MLVLFQPIYWASVVEYILLPPTSLETLVRAGSFVLVIRAGTKKEAVSVSVKELVARKFWCLYRAG